MNQSCKKCRASFTTDAWEQNFLTRVAPKFGEKVYQFPLPEHCPACREQQRMAWRNERQLFSRKCSKSGEALISMFPPGTEFPVFHNRLWWDDSNDALQFGKAVDFTQPVFEQMKALQRVAPRLHTFNYAEERQVNSRYTNCAGDLKDCYLIFGSGQDEGCAYSNYIVDCEYCFDCLFALKCNSCYEGIDLEGCHTLFYSSSCKQCFDSMFLDDCRSCRDCIGCVGLRQQRLHILNQPATKEQVQQLRTRLLTGGEAVRAEFIERLNELKLSLPRKCYHGENNENSTGDFIWNTRNCVNCFDTSGAEDCRYCTWFTAGRDCMDVYSWGEAELCYQISGGGQEMYQCAFTAKSFGCQNSYYLDLCMYCRNCIACVGLKKQEYCILNRKYSKAEYEQLAPQVIELMQRHGEWGKYLPAAQSPWGYNHTIAADYYALDAATAIAQGFSWSDYVAPQPSISRGINAAELPADIGKSPPDILELPVLSAQSGRPYRITQQELNFYKIHGIPLPQLHHEERYFKRLAAREPRKLWSRECGKCGVSIQSCYAPERTEQVWCEACYQRELYI